MQESVEVPSNCPPMTRPPPRGHYLKSTMGVCLVLAATLATSPGRALAAPGDTALVSVSSAEVPGSDHSDSPAISADGRYITFVSRAGNLVAGDTNGNWDVFVRDSSGGTTTRVSVSSSGVQADDLSDAPDISSDGRYVAFVSLATNLVGTDNNGTADAFIRDRTTGGTSRISISTLGIEGDDYSGSPSVSADGRYVAFDSFASNLIIGDNNGTQDVFVRDRQLGVTSRVSVSSGGVEGNALSGSPAISSDGRYVAFTSWASNLVTGDSNLVSDVFIHDRSSSITSRASVSATGVEGNGESSGVSISGNGTRVAFHSYAANLVSGDTNGTLDVFVRDIPAATTTLVSRSTAGDQGNSRSDVPAISSDGRFVAFTSASNNLIAADTNASWDIFVRDLGTAKTSRASVSTSGVEGNNLSDLADLSSDGRLVTFQSRSTNLVSGDTNASFDVFAHEGDPLPPGAPVLSAGAQGGLVNLQWTKPSENGSSITSYNLYRGTAPGSLSFLTSTAALSYQDVDVVSETTYYYQVAGINPAGEGVRSNTAAARPDTTPPAVPVIETPAEGGLSPRFATVSGSAEGGSTVKVYRDGAYVKSTASKASGAWSVTVDMKTEGLHGVSATATDAASNVGEPSPVRTFEVDAQPPNIEIFTQPGGVFPPGGAEILGRATDNRNVSTISVVYRNVFGEQVATGQAKCPCPGKTVNWSETPPGELLPGYYEAIFTVFDLVGNFKKAGVSFYYTR